MQWRVAWQDGVQGARGLFSNFMSLFRYPDKDPPWTMSWSLTLSLSSSAAAKIKKMKRPYPTLEHSYPTTTDAVTLTGYIIQRRQGWCSLLFSSPLPMLKQCLLTHCIFNQVIRLLMKVPNCISCSTRQYLRYRKNTATLSSELAWRLDAPPQLFKKGVETIWCLKSLGCILYSLNGNWQQNMHYVLYASLNKDSQK